MTRVTIDAGLLQMITNGLRRDVSDGKVIRGEWLAEIEKDVKPASNVFPLNPNGTSKWAHLQKHDGAEAIGVVFRTGSGSVGSLVDGRVVWADWLARPSGSKPAEAVNAELLNALSRLKSEVVLSDIDPDYIESHFRTHLDKAALAIASAESTNEISTLPDVSLVNEGNSPCAGRAIQQESDEPVSQKIIDYVKGVYAFLESTSPAGFADEAFRLPPLATRAQQLFAGAIQGDEHGKRVGSEGQDSQDRERHAGAVAKVSPCAGHAVQQEADLCQIVGIKADRSETVLGSGVMPPKMKAMELLNNYGFNPNDEYGEGGYAMSAVEDLINWMVRVGWKAPALISVKQETDEAGGA